MSFIEKVGNFLGRTPSAPKEPEIDLLEAFVPLSLITEITSKCNLRCLYCSKTDPVLGAIPGRDEHMQEAVIERYLGVVKQYPWAYIQLSGTGEPSFHPDWVKI